MTVDQVPAAAATSLEELYRDRRAELYRALVLITGNRDIATEAIDRGYRSWNQRIRRGRGHRPEVEVLSRGMRWARRRLRGTSGQIEGFRLPGPESDSDAGQIARPFARLSLDQRSVLVSVLVLGWSPAEAAVIAGIEEASAEPLLAQAHVTLGNGQPLDVDEVATALTADVAGAREPLSRYEAVRTSSMTRRIGTLVGSAVLTVVIVGGGVLAVGSSSPAKQPEAAGTVDQGVLLSGASELEITWAQIQLPIREGETQGVAHGSNGFVVLAQDWSGAPSTRIVQSDDGVSWQIVGDLMADQDGFVHQLVTIGDMYVAAGELFDRRNGNQRAVVWTSTDGLSWGQIELPVDDSVEIDGIQYDLYTNVNSVTGGPGGLAVLVSQHAEVDFEPIFRDALPDDVDFDFFCGWSDVAVEFCDDQGTTASVPFDDLDIDPEVIQLLTSGRSVLYTSTDSAEWTARPIDVGQAGRGIGNVVLTDTVAAALVWGRFGASIQTGPIDGEWTRAEVPGMTLAQGVASINGAVVVVGSDDKGQGAVWLSDDAVTWERIHDPDLAGNIHSVTSSGSLITAFGNLSQGLNLIGPAFVDVPEGTVEVTSTGLYTLRDLEGNEVLTVSDAEIDREGTDLRLLDPDTGVVAASISQKELDFAFESMFRAFEVEQRPFDEPEQFVVFSTDGRDWVRLDLSTPSGTFYPSGIAVAADVIVMTGFQDGGGFLFEERGPSPVIWVGTVEA